MKKVIKNFLKLTEPWLPLSARSAARRQWRRSRLSGQKSWLGQTKGVVHVGANSGEERHVYADLSIPVLWVEPIPSVYEQLRHNIASMPLQKAVRALLSDVSGHPYTLNISNNNGASSSIFLMDKHVDIWPSVRYMGHVKCISQTLDDILDAEDNSYDALILDVQGAELLVLMGATKHLRRFRFVQVEACDFPAYTGGCTAEDLDKFLQCAGFRLQSTRSFAQHPEGGTYMDIVYQRTEA